MLSRPTQFLGTVRDGSLKDSLFLDWLEASCLFLPDRVTKTDVIDYLLQEQILERPDDASEFVGSAWSFLEMRLSWLGEYSPISIDGRWMSKRIEWQSVPAHSYCLVASHGPRCEGWHAMFGPDYTEQGRLFELISQEAIKNLFPGWKFLMTGWSRQNTSRLVAVIDDLVGEIHERRGNPDDYLDRDAKDAGVDLVFFRPFADSRGGAPIYLTQCASGKDWIDKILEPNIAEWMKIVDFAAPPNKAFSIPYALDERELRRQSNRAGGLVIDRYRLLSQDACESDWVPSSLKDELVGWLVPRVSWLTGNGETSVV